MSIVLDRLTKLFGNHSVVDQVSLELANGIMLSSSEKRWVKLPISRARFDALLAGLRRRSKSARRAVRVRRVTDPRQKI